MCLCDCAERESGRASLCPACRGVFAVTGETRENRAFPSQNMSVHSLIHLKEMKLSLMSDSVYSREADAVGLLNPGLL